MSPVPESVLRANQQLASLSAQFAEGELDRVSFRQQRRSLICSVTGEPVPEVPAAHDQLDLPREDDTLPGTLSVETPMQSSRGVEAVAVAPVAAAAQEEAPAEVPSEPAPAEPVEGVAARRRNTLHITLLLVLLALVGLGGLLWFVFR